MLVPHEALRLEMAAMERSVNSLEPDAKEEGWKVVNYSQWYINMFYAFVHSHHHHEVR